MIIESFTNSSEGKNKIIILIDNWKVDFRIQSSEYNELNYFWPLYKNMNNFKFEIERMEGIISRESLEIDYILNVDNYFCLEDKRFCHVLVSPLALAFVYKNIALIECGFNKKPIQYFAASLVYFLKAYYKNLIKLLDISYLKKLINSSLSSKNVKDNNKEYYTVKAGTLDFFDIEIYIKKENYLKRSIEEIMSRLNFDNILNCNIFNHTGKK